MTNDLPNENITQGEAPEVREAPAAQEEKTVFTPSPWERRREERAAKAAAPIPGETAAHREEREAQRQQAAAEAEAKRLELKIAQENRKAQEEQNRRERKAQEEERRRERKAQEEERRERERQRKEEDRQRRKEEKAEQASVRRVGTLTLGLALIAIGAAILAYMISPGFDIRIVAYLAPVILIALGAEILIRQLIGKGKPFRYDFASGFICVLLVIGSFAVALVPYVLYYISPERFSTQEQQLDGVRDQLYAAFQGEQRIRNYSVDGNVGNILSAAHVDENGHWTYQLDYLIVDITLMDSWEDEAAFAKTCRQLMDKMTAQGFNSDSGDGQSWGDHFTLHLGCPENDQGTSYNLWVDNRLKLGMDAATLKKLVVASYSVPTRENGWTNDGYEELAEDFGTEYADHFAILLEQYGPDVASRYYDVLTELYLVDVAENYYWSCINGDGPEEVPTDDSPDETEDETENASIAVPDETPDPGVDGIDKVENVPTETDDPGISDGTEEEGGPTALQ